MSVKAILSGYLPTESGITDDLAQQLWPALGKEIVIVGVLKVDQHAERADGDKPRTLTLKVVDLEVALEVALDDVDADALRKALRALFRARTAEGTLDEVNPRDPTDGMSAAEVLEGGSTLTQRGKAEHGAEADGWEYDQAEGTEGDTVTEPATAGAT